MFQNLSHNCKHAVLMAAMKSTSHGGLLELTMDDALPRTLSADSVRYNHQFLRQLIA